MRTVMLLAIATGLLASAHPAAAQDLAKGPFTRMVIRSAMVIDGTGAPPQGPMDIVVEGGRIAAVALVGNDFGTIDPKGRPKPGDYEVDATGMYVMPGFINAHVHIAGEKRTELPVAYDYYLRLGHGVTSMLEAGSGNGVEWTVEQKRASAAHTIIAPRIFAYVRPGMGWDRPVNTPDRAREWVRVVAQKGADGLKLGAHRPDIMQALIDEAHKQGLRTTAHLAQNGVARMNALDASRLGLDSLQHWYGLAESMLDRYSIPDWRTTYNNANEEMRFSDAGRFFSQAVERGSPRWNALLEEFRERDLTLVPTFSIYEFLRDFMRVQQAEWHQTYSAPALLAFWSSGFGSHGAVYYGDNTTDETNWFHNYVKWEQFVNDFKNRGGRVAAGADEGGAYSLPGFGFIREFELLQQAGFHPLEVIRSATMASAAVIGMADKLGTVEAGKNADLVIIDQNPLRNFKVLYGTGARQYDPATGQTRRIGGIKYTIKDGIVYDAKGLMKEVARMVDDAKRQRTRTTDSRP